MEDIEGKSKTFILNRVGNRELIKGCKNRSDQVRKDVGVG